MLHPTCLGLLFPHLNLFFSTANDPLSLPLYHDVSLHFYALTAALRVFVAFNITEHSLMGFSLHCVLSTTVLDIVKKLADRREVTPAV